jgi:hypothetical protein
LAIGSFGELKMTYWHKMIFKTVHTLQNVIEIRC